MFRFSRLPAVRARLARRACASSLVAAALVAAALVAPAGCGGERAAAAPPPPASLLVSAGDSTFWVESDSSGVRVRRSPMLLTEVDGRFHELYLTDDDRSYYDAIIVGQRIFRRDLELGDSLLLLEDATLAQLARDYAARHPGEVPLAPDEDAAEEPSTHATTETELLDAAGPYLTFEQHVDIDVVGDRDQHVTRRGVIDVRSARQVTIADLAGERQAGEIFRQAHALLDAALDSIRRANDERARRAATTLTGFVFDSLSFALVDEASMPAVAFLVPGRGPRAGGYALPLPPIRIGEAPWWEAIRAGLPSDAAGASVWGGAAYEVVARGDSTGESAQLALRVAPNEWVVARLPAPVRRIHRLDRPGVTPAALQALRRAFDEAALYSGEVRTASHQRPPRTIAAWRSRPASTAP
ncbi:MAG: hypothetical protein ACLGIK_04695 [Gemmatimonadota bacterium]